MHWPLSSTKSAMRHAPATLKIVEIVGIGFRVYVDTASNSYDCICIY